MTKLLSLDRWKKQSIPERKTFSDGESDEEDEEAEKEEQIVIPRSKRKVQTDAESKATQATPEAHSKTARAAPNRWHRITKKATPGFIVCARTPS